MAGGGHIAALNFKGSAWPSPLWAPHWQTIEPWHYRAAHAGRYGSKLLASIFGHNLCLGAFGDPSPEEARAGQSCHGEAAVLRWRPLKKHSSAKRIIFSYGCELPIARMKFRRRLSLPQGSTAISIKETLSNKARCDVPFTICQHVTFGPPFLEPGTTVFDMSSAQGQTFPGFFGQAQRLKSATAFHWPHGPGKRGRVDLRTMRIAPNSDYYVNLMNKRHSHAWFSAVNPKQGLLLAYIWNRSDFPWLGVWEENHARKSAPWDAKTLARGMEFSNTPFPIGLRKAVEMGRFQGQPSYRWLPALGTVAFEYTLLWRAVPPDCRGVADIKPAAHGFNVELK